MIRILFFLDEFSFITMTLLNEIIIDIVLPLGVILLILLNDHAYVITV